MATRQTAYQYEYYIYLLDFLIGFRRRRGFLYSILYFVMAFYNATRIDHFNFTALWNITQSIKAFNPLDPRLFYPIVDNVVDKSRTLLTYKGCVDLVSAGNNWAHYDISDVRQRVQLWKAPLIQLIAQMQLPPLGWRSNIFVLVHLIADPIDTNWSLAHKIYLCHSHAVRWSGDKDWKALGMIVVSYDEWGEGNTAAKALKEALNGHGDKRDQPLSLNQQKSIRDACLQAARSLSADRATSFIPMTVALAIFMGAIGAAFDKNASGAVSINNSVTPHYIASTTLYIAILPAVFLSAFIGVSQQQSAIPRFLNRLHTDVEEHKQLPRRFGYWKRGTSGGIYSWQPGKLDSLKSSIGSWHPRINAALSFSTVIAGTVVAVYMSYSAPPVGFGCREITHSGIFLMWTFSALFDIWVEKALSGKASFAAVCAKDLLCMTAILIENIYSHLGMFNRCVCWTNFGNGPLCFATESRVAEELHQKISKQWAITVACLVVWEILVVVVVCSLSFKGISMLLSPIDDRVEKDGDNDSEQWQIGWRHLFSQLREIRQVWRTIKSGEKDQPMRDSGVRSWWPYRIPTLAFDSNDMTAPLWPKHDELDQTNTEAVPLVAFSHRENTPVSEENIQYTP